MALVANVFINLIAHCEKVQQPTTAFNSYYVLSLPLEMLRHMVVFDAIFSITCSHNERRLK